MNIICRTLFLPLIAIILAACNAMEQEAAPVLTQDHLFFDYNITAAEDRDYVTLRLEFKQSSKSRGLLLHDSSGVELDGEKLRPDSSKYSGVFYEASRPLSGFTGKHIISFTGTDGRKMDEEFWFLPFRLKEELPQTMGREPFRVKIDNPDSLIRVFQLVLVDTSFYSRDVNDDVSITNGEIAITEAMFNRLANGPVIFELHSEKITPLNQGSPKGGRLAIFYSMNREFELTD